MNRNPTFAIHAEWRTPTRVLNSVTVAGLSAIRAAHILNELTNSPTPPTFIGVTVEPDDSGPAVYTDEDRIFTVGLNAHQDDVGLRYRARSNWFG